MDFTVLIFAKDINAERHYVIIIIPNFIQIHHKIWKLRVEIREGLQSVTVTAPIFTKLTHTQQLFVNFHIEFHENLTNGLVADNRSRVYGQTEVVVST